MCCSTAARTRRSVPWCSRAGRFTRLGHIGATTRIQGRAVFTNTPPNGAFRGFGAPQTEFAVEVHMERIAEALGMDSVALRRMNALRSGDTTATGQTLREDTSALMVLDEAVRRSEERRVGK